MQSLELASGSRGDGMHLLPDRLADGPLRLFKVVVQLQTQPETLRCPEVAREAQGRVGRDGALAEDDLVDPARRHLDIPRQPVLADSKRQEKLFKRDFPRMDIGEALLHAWAPQ